MALRSGYKGIKKLAAGLKWNRPGVLAADDLALANVFFPRSEQAVLGAKNLLENVASSKTEGNVTYTVNDDGSVSVATSGTASSDVVLIINNGTTQLENGVRYILSGNEASHDGYIYIRYVKGGNVGYVQLDDYDEVSFINDNWTSFDVRIVVKSGKTVNKIFYPMIRLATDHDHTFASFAMTNKQLTKRAELVDEIVETANNNTILSTTAIGDLINGKPYMISGDDTGNPFSGYNLEVIAYKYSDATGVQVGWKISNSADVSSNVMIYRLAYNNTWSHWAKITGTDIS